MSLIVLERCSCSSGTVSFSDQVLILWIWCPIWAQGGKGFPFSILPKAVLELLACFLLFPKRKGLFCFVCFCQGWCPVEGTKGKNGSRRQWREMTEWPGVPAQQAHRVVLRLGLLSPGSWIWSPLAFFERKGFLFCLALNCLCSCPLFPSLKFFLTT